MDEMKDGHAADATKAVLVENYQRGEPTTFAFYGGFESRDESRSKQVSGKWKSCTRTVASPRSALLNDDAPIARGPRPRSLRLANREIM
jgi:hypothetical protein